DNVIGISFGSGYSCVSILNKDHKPEIIANEDGEHKIATALSFLDNEELYGNQAKAQTVRNARNTVCNFQPLVGTPYEASVAARYPNNTVVDQEGRVGFQVEFNGRQAVFTAEELTVKFLQRLREMAENYLGRSIEGVILACPSSYSAAQGKTLRTLAGQAGLNVLQMVDEIPAAVLAYGLGQTSTPQEPQDSNTLVVDAGAQSTTVAVVAIRGGLYNVVSTVHNSQFSGQAYDQLLWAHLQAEFKKQTKLDITGNARAHAKLALGSEITKRTLSSSNSAPCSVDSLAEGLDLHCVLNRTRFDILTNKLYPSIQASVQKALAEASIYADEIDEVIFVGGTSRVLKLQAKVLQLLNPEVRVCTDLEADEVVVFGCAAQARLVTNGILGAASASQTTVVSATTQPLGLQLGDKFATVVPRYTPLPVSRTITVTTPFTYAYVAVAQGKVEQRVTMSVPEDSDDEAGEERHTE
ncbi:heat shock protein 70 family, partial [Dimargaris cristalligena]